MRFLTTGALGLAALAIAAVVRRPSGSSTATKAPAARLDPPVTWLVRLPESTPAHERPYLCGNVHQLGGWNPRGVALQRVEAGLYRVSLRVPAGTTLEYKLTRGSWASVEKRRDGSERLNRSGIAAPHEVIEVEVEAWSDRG